MGTDQLGKAFSKHAPTTPRIGTTKSPDQQLDVDRPAVSGQIHQQPCIAAVPATGDATAQRARRSRSGALGGDGNVCRGKFLLPDDQTDASKKSPHTAKPRSKGSQRGSRLSRKLLLPAAALHRNCGRPSFASAVLTHFIPATTAHQCSKKVLQAQDRLAPSHGSRVHGHLLVPPIELQPI